MFAFSFGPTEALILLGVVLLLFGAPRLPKLARSLGQASKEFRRGVDEDSQDADDETPGATKSGQRRSETRP